MTQQTSPFLEGKYGWALGESNWNLGMDDNLLKFSYLFDKNIDGIVSSLPVPVNGKAYFNTTDKRVYYVVSGSYLSSPVPKWFSLVLRDTGETYQFDGTNLQLSLNPLFLSDATELSKGAATIGRAWQAANSVAQLKLLRTNGPSKYAQTSGYYVGSTEGAGMYYVPSSFAGLVDNGGSILQAADGGFWVLNHNGEVNAEQFGAKGDGSFDNSGSINAMLLAFSGKTVKLQAGKNYKINSPLLVYSSTTVMAIGAKLTRGSSMDNMIRNYSDGTVGLYGASSDIKIIGGLWDTNGTSFPTPASTIAFGHATNILIDKVKIINVPTYHHIEINSCQNVKVLNSTFLGGAEQANIYAEAIQIDLNIDMSQFPWFGPADSTRCVDITIENNYFQDCGTGIGTHSSIGGINHNNIKIRGNFFKSPYYAGVSGLNWSDVKIQGNSFDGGYYGVTEQTSGTSFARSHIITENSFYNIGATAFVGTGARSIYLTSSDGSGSNRMQSIVIANNSVLDMTTVGKSSNGIHVNYCDRVNVCDNTITNVRQHGITTFACTGVVMSDNTCTLTNQVAGAFASIEVNSCTGANVGNNNLETIRAIYNTQVMVRNNIITSAAGLTNTSNTSSILSENLINGTFA